MLHSSKHVEISIVDLIKHECEEQYKATKVSE